MPETTSSSDIHSMSMTLKPTLQLKNSPLSEASTTKDAPTNGKTMILPGRVTIANLALQISAVCSGLTGFMFFELITVFVSLWSRCIMTPIQMCICREARKTAVRFRGRAYGSSCPRGPPLPRHLAEGVQRAVLHVLGDMLHRMGFHERDLRRYSSLVGVAEGNSCDPEKTWKACVVHKIMIKFTGNRTHADNKVQVQQACSSTDSGNCGPTLRTLYVIVPGVET
ncbi:hypothetical protein BDR05DRAFT_946194 [Suillus weaverae]|nr:hypothetical protein BDR05DRAFT_946194 [Suillus weaverae]